MGSGRARRHGMARHVTDLLGKTDLAGLIHVLRFAAWTLSVDSGPMHLAAGISDRVLSIHTWSNPPMVGPRRSGAWIFRESRLVRVSDLDPHPPSPNAATSLPYVMPRTAGSSIPETSKPSPDSSGNRSPHEGSPHLHRRVFPRKSGPGGYGTLVRYGAQTRELAQGFVKTTNNRMEILSAIAGLEILKEPCRVVIHSDSRYLVDAQSKGWVEKWKKLGWRKADKSAVKNVDLWMRLERAAAPHRIEWIW